MASRIEHSGVVERAERDTVYVRITSHSACGTCKAREACGLAEAQDKIVAVKSPDAAHYAAGEKVMVGVRRSAGAVAVILAYVGTPAEASLAAGEALGAAGAFGTLGSGSMPASTMAPVGHSFTHLRQSLHFCGSM